MKLKTFLSLGLVRDQDPFYRYFIEGESSQEYVDKLHNTLKPYGVLSDCNRGWTCCRARTESDANKIQKILKGMGMVCTVEKCPPQTQIDGRWHSLEDLYYCKECSKLVRSMNLRWRTQEGNDDPEAVLVHKRCHREVVRLSDMKPKEVLKHVNEAQKAAA